jgi:hypothetical protein
MEFLSIVTKTGCTSVLAWIKPGAVCLSQAYRIPDNNGLRHLGQRRGAIIPCLKIKNYPVISLRYKLSVGAVSESAYILVSIPS